jgi:hypothetical protein
MHKHGNEELAQTSNNRILQVDFHDFLQKAPFLEDVELSQAFGLTLDEIRFLQNKWAKSRR